MKPTFVIIGEQKCGTGWLRDRLREHPRVHCHATEVNFFNHRRNYSRGLSWYAKLLNGSRNVVAIGEKSPDYFWLNRPAPEYFANPLEILARDLPEVKIVLSLRDPVERAVSAFMHHLQHRGSRIHPRLARDVPIEELLFDAHYEIAERWGILQRGLYSDRLRLAQRLFGRRLLTLIFENDIVGDPARGMRLVCEHLGVSFEAGRFRLRDNSKERKPSYRELLAGYTVPVLRPALRRLPLGKPYRVHASPAARKRLAEFIRCGRCCHTQVVGPR